MSILFHSFVPKHLLGLPLVLAVAISGSCMLSTSCFKNTREPKIDKIKAIWRDLPIYPGMIEVAGGSTVSGFDKAYLSKNFRSSADYGEIRQFYEAQLTRNGWQLSQERQLKTFEGGMSSERSAEFRRGEYELTIDYAPEALGYGWNYAISVTWLLVRG